jgi:hypothetical protein
MYEKKKYEFVSPFMYFGYGQILENLEKTYSKHASKVTTFFKTKNGKLVLNLKQK